MEENNFDEDSEEVGEIEIMEISLTDGEINELIDKLLELKETKQEVNFEIDEDNELVIKYEEDEDE